MCIHGTSSSALVWADAVASLARAGRVIVYDRRGCTRSERPEPYERTSVGEHADDAAALLGALEATPAVVIGRSCGGEVAIDLALRYPDTVVGLVLREAALFSLTPATAPFVAELMASLRNAARDPSTVGEVFIRRVLGDAAWEGFPASLQAMFRDNGPAIRAELNGGGLAASRNQLGRISKPTLVVGGTDSPEPFALANQTALSPTAPIRILHGPRPPAPAREQTRGAPRRFD